MKFNFKHEKTTVWQLDNQFIQVSNLPDEYKNEIATFDRLMEDKLEAIYQVEKIELAAMLKGQQIHALIAQLVKKANEEQEAAAKQAANDASVKQELNKLDTESKENGEKPTKKPRK